MTESAQFATHFGAVSESAAMCFPAEIRDRVNIIWNGIDLDRCAPSRSREDIRKEWAIEEETVAIGYVGRFADEKNPLAAALAATHIPNSVAIYAGPRFDEGATRKKIESVIGDRCRVFVPDHVGDVFAGLDCLVACAPSEGAPNIVQEAFAAGVPVVATPVGMIPECERRWGKLVETVPIAATGPELGAAVQRAIAPENRTTVDRVRSIAWQYFSAARMAEDWKRFLVATIVEGNRAC